MTTKRSKAGARPQSPRRLFLYLIYDGNQELDRITAGNLDEAERKASKLFPHDAAEVRRLFFPGRQKARSDERTTKEACVKNDAR